MNDYLTTAILLCGCTQLSILVASALVPTRLNWKENLQGLPLLLRQMYWVYGGYVVMAIIAFALISLVNAEALASGSTLARSLCAYIAIFWGVRLCLQFVFDVREHLTHWFLRVGYLMLTILFSAFTLVYGYAALH